MHNFYLVQRENKLHRSKSEGKKNFDVPNVGLEPTTLRLRVSCSTD